MAHPVSPAAAENLSKPQPASDPTGSIPAEAGSSPIAEPPVEIEPGHPAVDVRRQAADYPPVDIELNPFTPSAPEIARKVSPEHSRRNPPEPPAAPEGPADPAPTPIQRAVMIEPALPEPADLIGSIAESQAAPRELIPQKPETPVIDRAAQPAVQRSAEVSPPPSATARAEAPLQGPPQSGNVPEIPQPESPADRSTVRLSRAVDPQVGLPATPQFSGPSGRNSHPGLPKSHRIGEQGTIRNSAAPGGE